MLPTCTSRAGPARESCTGRAPTVMCWPNATTSCARGERDRGRYARRAGRTARAHTVGHWRRAVGRSSRRSYSAWPPGPAGRSGAVQHAPCRAVDGQGLGEPIGHSGSGAHRQQRDVVGPARSGENRSTASRTAATTWRAGLPAARAATREQPVGPELLPAAPALGDAVGVEQQRVAGAEPVAGALHQHLRHQPDRRAERPRPARPGRRRAPAPAARGPASSSSTSRPPDRSPSRRTSAAASVQNCSGSAASIITSLSRCTASAQPAPVAHQHAQHVADEPGAGRGAGALAADVADRDQPARRVDGEHVVEVAADVAAAAGGQVLRRRSRARAPRAGRGGAAPAAAPATPRRGRRRSARCGSARAARRAMSPTRTTSSGACGRPSGRPTSRVPIAAPRDRSGTASPSVGVAMRTGAVSGAHGRRRARRAAPGAGPGRASGSSAARSSGSSFSSAWVSAASRSVPASEQVHGAPAAQPRHHDLRDDGDGQVHVERLARAARWPRPGRSSRRGGAGRRRAATASPRPWRRGRRPARRGPGRPARSAVARRAEQRGSSRAAAA